MDRITAAQVFVCIAEQGSLSAAAERLDMSRAMVTRYLAEMEGWIGARLFHRSTRRLSLTTAGGLALERCRAMLALAGELPLLGEAQSEQPRGVLRLACAPSLAEALLARAVAAFVERYPGTHVDLQTSDKAVNLVEERIDLAVRITNTLEPGMIARRLADCHSVICAAPAYLARRGRPSTPDELAGHACLTYDYFGSSVWQLGAPGLPAPLAVPVWGPLSSNDACALLQAALAGAGVSLQPLYAVAGHLAAGRLEALLPAYQPRVMGIHAIYLSRQYQPAILRAMLDFLAEWMGQEPALQAPEVVLSELAGIAR
ncbi:MAG: LysR family transcriptional regulator [Zoogloea sp.]|uniref:LysR family transcriptional regulator n=1 Tax=Zoogloea sp. TaxID=49181 RepID=UPI003F32B6E1